MAVLSNLKKTTTPAVELIAQLALLKHDLLDQALSEHKDIFHSRIEVTQRLKELEAIVMSNLRDGNLSSISLVTACFKGLWDHLLTNMKNNAI